MFSHKTKIYNNNKVIEGIRFCTESRLADVGTNTVQCNPIRSAVLSESNLRTNTKYL